MVLKKALPCACSGGKRDSSGWCGCVVSCDGPSLVLLLLLGEESGRSGWMSLDCRECFGGRWKVRRRSLRLGHRHVGIRET